MRLLDQVKQIVGGANVFGQPYEKDGLTVIPAFRVTGGGGGGQESEEGAGGGGAGVDARPAGAFVVKEDDVRWLPALDVNRMIFVGQLVAIVALLSWRSVARARARAAKAK